MMSLSIAQEDPFQLLKHCDGRGELLRSLMAQTEQYLFLTPMNSSFLVAAPKITPMPDLAL